MIDPKKKKLSRFFFRLEKSCGTRWDWLQAIQSARACAKKRQKTEGESENEARSLEEGKRVRGILSLPNFVLPGKSSLFFFVVTLLDFPTVPIEEPSWQSVLLREE